MFQLGAVNICVSFPSEEHLKASREASEIPYLLPMQPWGPQALASAALSARKGERRVTIPSAFRQEYSNCQ